MICALILGLLLAFHAPVALAADALDFDYAHTTTQVQASSSTYVACETVDVYQATGGNVDYIIMGHMSFDNTGVVAARLQKTAPSSSTLMEAAQNGSASSAGWDLQDSDEGQTWPWVKKVTVTSGSTHTFELQFNSDSGTVDCENAALVALEYDSATMQYTERTQDSETCYDTDSYTTHLDLEFTATAEDWLIVWAGEFLRDDESDIQVQGPKFYNDTDAVTYQWEVARRTRSDNDGAYHMRGGAAYATLTAETKSFHIDVQGGGGSSDSICTRNASIFAAPESAFENFYSDNQTGESTTASTSFVDTTTTVTPTLNEAEHLAIVGWESRNDTDSNASCTQFDIGGGTVQFPSCGDDDMNSLDGDIAFFVYGEDSSSGSKTFKLQHRALANNAYTGPAYVVVVEIPTGAAARRRVPRSVSDQ